jgi:hypothetical protein
MPAAELHQHPHDLAALDLADEHDLEAVEIDRFAVSPDCSISRRRYGWLWIAKSRLETNALPTVNDLRPIVPQPEVARLVDVVHLLERVEQPVRRRAGRPTRCAISVSVAPPSSSDRRFENRQSAREALNVRRRRTGFGLARRAASGEQVTTGGEACRRMTVGRQPIVAYAPAALARCGDGRHVAGAHVDRARERRRQGTTVDVDVGHGQFQPHRRSRLDRAPARRRRLPRAGDDDSRPAHAPRTAASGRA